MFEVDEQGSTGSTTRSCGPSSTSSRGPGGASTLAAAVGEEPDTVEDVVEPYLLQLGFLQRTPAAAWPRSAPTRTSASTAPGPAPALTPVPAGRLAPRASGRQPRSERRDPRRTTSQAGSPFSLLVFLLPLGLMFFFMRSQKRKMRAQQALQSAAQIGDEVLTTSGMFGTIVDEDEDEGTVHPGDRARHAGQDAPRRDLARRHDDSRGRRRGRARRR